MRFPISILDVTAAIFVVVAIVLPPRVVRVRPPYPSLAEFVEDIDRLQSKIQLDPSDGAAVEDLADLLSRAQYTEWALRIAGEALLAPASATKWRVYRALAAAHADRWEPKDTYTYAQQALDTCRAAGSVCNGDDDLRLRMYVSQIKAAMDSGIDPKADPEGFVAEMRKAGGRSVILRDPGPAEEPEESLDSPESADPPSPALDRQGHK